MDIIRSGVVLVVYTFIVIVVYFLAASPFNAIFDGFDDADIGDATSHLDSYVPYVKFIFQMMFACAVSVIPTWFVFKVLEREPQWIFNQ